jgi:CNT family concentrative nucleoside transporter
MGRGALFAAMTLGMATIAGTVMALYALILDSVLPRAAGHVLAASLMNAPAALMLACLVVPDGFSEGPKSAEIRLENAPRSTMDAVAQGTVDGLKLLAAVVAMLVVMVALVSIVNELLSLLGDIGGRPITLQRLLGYLCAPLAFAIGIPWGETMAAGSLIGQKIVLNEFLAYLDLARTPTGVLSERSRLILTYGLCGFANLGSLGIMVGGLTAMVPERRADIIELAPGAMVLGALATLLSGAVVGLIGAG